MIYLVQGAKKIIFTACHSGKLRLAFTSLNIISTTPKNFLTSRIDFTVLLLFEFFFPSKNITCLSGKLKTEFTSLIAKSTNLGLLDTTLFARCRWIALCSFWTTRARCNFTLVLVFAFPRLCKLHVKKYWLICCCLFQSVVKCMRGLLTCMMRQVGRLKKITVND